jgi:hypothetical protein
VLELITTFHKKITKLKKHYQIYSRSRATSDEAKLERHRRFRAARSGRPGQPECARGHGGGVAVQRDERAAAQHPVAASADRGARLRREAAQGARVRGRHLRGARPQRRRRPLQSHLDHQTRHRQTHRAQCRVR